MINLHNGDCMDALAKMQDNQFDLAIVDPPYGIGKDGQKKEVYKGKKAKHNKKAYKYKGWDNSRPDKTYFDHIFRVSKHQIIWGANYFIEYIKSTPCFIFWDKGQKLDQADGELAFCSMNKPVRSVTINRAYIAKCGGSIHPTQKPVKLYEWLLMNYANEGDKILDTHLGSGSIAIACHNLGYDLEGYELDEEYYNAAVKRYNDHVAQLKLF